MTPLYAHAGHWLVQFLYAASILIMVALLAVGKVREWRREPRDDDKKRH